MPKTSLSIPAVRQRTRLRVAVIQHRLKIAEHRQKLAEARSQLAAVSPRKQQRE